jgi:hypothetical protein
MIMPYGRKDSGAEPGRGPAKIDFDALWERALRPFLEEDLGYDAVRADQDLGAMIIHEMIERLALADLVVADVTAPNGNVYYEVGVRHAAREQGCVLVAADWSRPLFDIAQMRCARYPLPEGDITPATAAAVRETLRPKVTALVAGRSPVYEVLPGYPAKATPATASSFRQQMQEMSRFLAEVRAVRAMPDSGAAAVALRDRYARAAATIASVAHEILYLLRDLAPWESVVEFVDSLPPHLQELPVMREQRALALSKTGDHFAAIGALEELIATSGDSSERRGLLGGRYKKLYAREDDPSRRTLYLDLAIEQYDRGMRQDLNDYYPSSNLPRLLRTRGLPGDEERARAAAAITVVACERALERDPSDPWLRPTLLGAAFDAGDVPVARRIAGEIRSGRATGFPLETTLPDLEAALGLLAEPAQAADLAGVVAELRRLLPAPRPG